MRALNTPCNAEVGLVGLQEKGRNSVTASQPASSNMHEVTWRALNSDER